MASLGSVSLAAGDVEGTVRVWHWRRGALKLVHNVAAHTARIHALSSGGDVLFTGSEDGDVAQLDTMEAFARSTFFSPGEPVHSVLARGLHVLVGSKSGCIWELSRRRGVAEVFRRLKLESGGPVLWLDADELAPGEGRILASGGGRLAVWLDPPRKRRGDPPSMSEESPGTPPDASWPAPEGAVSALLVAGGLGDYLTAGSDGLVYGPGTSIQAWASQAALAFPGPIHALVRGGSGGSASAFFMAPEKGKGPPERPPGAAPNLLAFELALFLVDAPAASEVEDSGVSGVEAGAAACAVGGDAAAVGEEAGGSGGGSVPAEVAPGAGADSDTAAAQSHAAAAMEDADARLSGPQATAAAEVEVDSAMAGASQPAAASARRTAKAEKAEKSEKADATTYPNPTVASIARQRETTRPQGDMA